MYGPSKSLGIQGRVESETPYKVIIGGMVDGTQGDYIEATLDKQKKTALLKVKYDKGNNAVWHSIMVCNP